MKAIDIRPYDEHQIEALADLWLASWQSTRVPQSKQTTREELRKRIPEELAKDWTVDLAFDGADLVGFLAVREPISRLDQLFVLPGRQGKGIGKALLDLAKERLPRGLWLTALKANRGACRFYEREGMECVGASIYRTCGMRSLIFRWGAVDGLERHMLAQDGEM